MTIDSFFLFDQIDGLLWVLLSLLPLIFLQRALHREIQAVFLLLTRSLEVALVIFSILFLPGVLLHELSHFLMAKLMFVRTGRFSLVPRQLEDGRLLLGYVETAPADFLRDSLIGVAPLISGGLFVYYVGRVRLNMVGLWDTFSGLNWNPVMERLGQMYSQPDFWIWFYLLVAVSSTMFPSSSDRRKWLSLLIAFSLLLGLAILAGIGPWMLENLAPYVNEFLYSLAIVFFISGAVHFMILIPTLLVRRLLSSALRLEVV